MHPRARVGRADGEGRGGGHERILGELLLELETALADDHILDALAIAVPARTCVLACMMQAALACLPLCGARGGKTGGGGFGKTRGVGVGGGGGGYCFSNVTNVE